MVGSQDNAIRIYKETEKNLHDGGYRYAGFVTPDNNGKNGYSQTYPKLGEVNDLENIIEANNISLVVLALEKSEQPLLENIINRLSEKDVEIKIQPNTLDILSGSVKTSNVMGAALIDLQTGLMPEWQQNIKRLIDVAVALSGICFIITIDVVCSFQSKIFFQRAFILFAGKNWI